jgi:hypothetical protein
MKWQVHALALGILATSLPALANTASDNVAWSAKPAVAASVQPECTAYSGRQISATSETTADPLVRALKVAGTLAATSALSVATKASNAAAPNPCRKF